MSEFGRDVTILYFVHASGLGMAFLSLVFRDWVLYALGIGLLALAVLLDILWAREFRHVQE